MTPDQLLKLTAKEWDTLSDADLIKIYEPFFNVTRPVEGKTIGSGNKLDKKREAAIRNKTRRNINKLKNKVKNIPGMEDFFDDL